MLPAGWRQMELPQYRPLLELHGQCGQEFQPPLYYKVHLSESMIGNVEL